MIARLNFLFSSSAGQIDSKAKAGRRAPIANAVGHFVEEMKEMSWVLLSVGRRNLIRGVNVLSLRDKPLYSIRLQ